MLAPSLCCPGHARIDGVTDDLMSSVQVQGRKKAISEFSGFIQDDNAEVSSSESTVPFLGCSGHPCCGTPD